MRTHARNLLVYPNDPFNINKTPDTPARTHSISGLKSRVLKLTFLSLKMMVKSGLEFILKFTKPLQRYLLTCQANSALMGRFFGTGQQQLWRDSVNFKIKKPRPLFTTILTQKCKFQDSRFLYTYKMSPSWCAEQWAGTK